jgi:hypothetical protein
VDLPRYTRVLEHLPEVRLPDPDGSPNPDRAQVAARDPRPDSLRMDPQTLCDVADSQELVVGWRRSLAATGPAVIRVRRHRGIGASDRHVV